MTTWEYKKHGKKYEVLKNGRIYAYANSSKDASIYVSRRIREKPRKKRTQPKNILFSSPNFKFGNPFR